MIASKVIPFFRDQWATRFIDTCTITRPNAPTFNPSTGTYNDTPTTIYTGNCLARPQAATDVDAGEQQVELRRFMVFIPHNITGVQVDDIVTMTSTYDGVLNGKTLVVRNVKADTYITVRTLECEDNQSG